MSRKRRISNGTRRPKNKGGKPPSPRSLEGVISVSSKGTGYVKLEGFKEDPEIDYRHLNTALHGDLVRIVLHPKRPGYRQTAEVAQILARAKPGFSGVLEEENGIFSVRPDDGKMYVNIFIPAEKLAGAKPGQKVFAEIISWKDSARPPEGKITKVFGRPGSNDAEMLAIAMEKGFEEAPSARAENEADKIRAKGITEADLSGRRDFREILTFTIDPADAKDFDDAISFRELPDGHVEIGIHIADVSHYVRPGSELDREARAKGTSVYLVDRTLPMLPEILSNDLCSLVPGKERLTMSAVFVLDKNARVIERWFGRTVIKSHKRFTYEEAEEAIKKITAPFHKELSALNALAKKLTHERFVKGAISLDQEEVRFVLDEHGRPLRVVKKERGDSNRLVEEFMLLANKHVAEEIGRKAGKNGVFVYRVHDLPAKEKVEELLMFLSGLGYKVSVKKGVIPASEINHILKTLEGTLSKDTVHRAIIRSMAKAAYSTKNIGHYGLAFKYYTHFTSPIRRYPDILVHRFLSEHLAGKKIGMEKIREYEHISRISSEQEKRAADAERASIKYKQVEYMSARIGEKFDGIISGITEWGIFAEEKETKCEGMIRIRDMADDEYRFDDKKMELVARRSKKKYRLGDRVKIKVKRTDLERRTIDYELV